MLVKWATGLKMFWYDLLMDQNKFYSSLLPVAPFTNMDKL